MSSLCVVDWSLKRSQICNFLLDLHELVTTLNIVDRARQVLQVLDDVLHLCEVVLVINRVDRTTESLDLDEILQDGVTIMLPLDVEDGVIQGLDVLDRSLKVPESVISSVNIIAGSLEALQRLNLFSNFIEVMLILTALSDWIRQLLTVRN